METFLFNYFCLFVCAFISTLHPPFERLLSLVKRALIANSVFLKTLSKSIYTSNMIKGGGQGGLQRKNY